MGTRDATRPALGAASADAPGTGRAQRRRQRRAEKHNATPAAMRAAEEAGIPIDEIEGTGADGRITVRDVREAVEA